MVDPRIARNIDLRVLDMVEKLEVKVIHPLKFEQINGYGCMQGIGIYDSRRDIISVLANKEDTFVGDNTSALLHELIHWTGHYNRLNRRMIGAAGLGKLTEEDVEADPSLRDTEEAVAQLGMVYLAQYLGLDSERHQEYFNQYIPHFPNANKAQAMKWAQEAATFVISKYQDSQRVVRGSRCAPESPAVP